jgi:hypothetical protein
MAGFDIDELMSVKNSYQSQKFQWVKTNDQKKLGTVVTVNDVIPGKRLNTINGPMQRYNAILSDGTSLDTEDLTSRLMMLLDDQPPMTILELLSINLDAGVNTEEIKAALPADLKELSTLKPSAPQLNQGAPGHDDSKFGPGRNMGPAVNSKDIFGLFSVEETNLNLSILVKMPSKPLLKIMYSNAQDKEQFLNQLSVYINNSITQMAIHDSVKRMFGLDKNKKADDQ